MLNISSFLYKKSNFWVCLIFSLVMGLYAWKIMGSQSECITKELAQKEKILDLRFGFNYSETTEFMQKLSTKALNCYIKLLTVWDNIFPIIYSLMYIFWISFILKKYKFKNSKLQIINLFPFIPAIFDFLQNLFIKQNVNTFLEFGSLNNTMVLLASIITQLKWILSFTNYVLIIFVIVLIIFSKK